MYCRLITHKDLISVCVLLVLTCICKQLLMYTHTVLTRILNNIFVLLPNLLCTSYHSCMSTWQQYMYLLLHGIFFQTYLLTYQDGGREVTCEYYLFSFKDVFAMLTDIFECVLRFQWYCHYHVLGLEWLQYPDILSP